MLCLREKSSCFLRWGVSFMLILSSMTLSAQSFRFRMAFSYDTHHLSGMLILKSEGEVVKGSMVNEFGVNFVEFTVKNGKAKIVRLNHLFKRPFLKKVLKRDLELLTQSLMSEESGVLWSKKGGIYRASCIRESDEERNLLSLQLEHQKLPLTITLNQF